MFDPSLQTIWGGNLTAVFCDTGWEHPDTYKHVNDVCLQMGVRLITLKSKYDFVSLAVHKKRFPSTNARFCTSELKMKPIYDKVYAAKVFTFTPDYNYYINANQIEKGGTGYDIEKVLPIEVDRLQPDYSIYNIDSNLSYGFLTRGCPNRCKWCVVPKKEGKISPYMDIEEITAGRKKAILMDNNILASNYGLQQIEKIIKLGIKVDFNHLITDEIARLLAKVKWIKRIRFGCDTPGQIAEVERASALIDKYGYKGEYFLYCILMDFEESFARVNYWKSKSRRFLPHCQPFRDLNNPHQIIPQWQKDMAHWADRKEIYMSCDFKDFSPRKGFLCKEYFKIL